MDVYSEIKNFVSLGVLVANPVTFATKSLSLEGNTKKINEMKLKSIIVDDEKHGRENLAGILREFCPEVTLPGEADSVEAALSLIREQPPDLIFPDIEKEVAGKTGELIFCKKLKK